MYGHFMYGRPCDTVHLCSAHPSLYICVVYFFFLGSVLFLLTDYFRSGKIRMYREIHDTFWGREQ
jgi:hypothetical protein